MFPNRSRHSPRVVLVTAYIIVALCVSHLYTMGTLFRSIMESFNTNRAQTAVVQSTAYAFFAIGGVFYGTFITRMGPQFVCITGTLLATTGLVISFFATSIVYLTISLGVLSAIGHGMQYVSCNVVVGQSFKDSQGSIALSILSTSAGIGATSYSFFMAYLLETFGLRGTLLILAALALHGLPLTLLWPTKPCNVAEENSEDVKQSMPAQERGELGKTDTSQQVQSETGDNRTNINLSVRESDVIKSTLSKDGPTKILAIKNRNGVDGDTKSSSMTINRTDAETGVFQRMKHIAGNINFVLLAVDLPAVISVSFMVLVFVVDMILDKGFTKLDGSTALLINNICSTAGRLAPGFILLIPKMTTLLVPVIGSLLGCLSYITLAFADSLTSLLIGFALSGTANGILLTCNTITVLRLVGKEYMSDAFGILLTIVGIGNAVTGPVTGYIRDQTGSYTTSLLSAAAAMFVGACIFVVNQYLKVQKQRQRMTSPVVSIFYITKM